jgi:EAL domain-containing protein (putative c-di-GMP-specific phosphodiesterase class I)
MAASSGEPLDNGGPRRIVELTARLLGLPAARATLLAGRQPLVVAGAGPLDDETERLLRAVTDEVLAGGVVVRTNACGAPLRSPGGDVVGALCAAGARDPRSRRDDPDAESVVTALAAVLADQLALLERVGLLRGDEAARVALTEAIDSGDVRPWYQPIVRLGTRELIGFEALARWHRTSGEIESPATFIGLAEETGLITRLDLAVLDAATADLARWRERRPALRLNVNFSGRHLADDGWVDAVHETVTRRGVPPANVDIELTESARPEDVVLGAERLQRLRTLGYTVWLDDFGTGWSELMHLVQVPVDGIKIDRFFAEALGGGGDAVVRALVGAAEEMGLATTIEGISRPEHAERALALGCDLAQGYLWSPPVPVADVDALVGSGESVLRL